MKHHASWCPAFWALQPVWEDLGSRSHDLGIKVARVDVTDAPGISARFKIVKPLTIFHAIDGDFREYKGPRRMKYLITFIKEKKWNEIVPLTHEEAIIFIAAIFFLVFCTLISQSLLLEPPYGTMQSLSDRSRASRPASTASSVAGDSVPASRPTTPSPSIPTPSSNEIDYKKLYEEEKAENKRLRETVQELRRVAKAKLERSVQVLYEEEKAENERLRETVQELRSELSDANAKLERSVQVPSPQIKCLFNCDD